MKWLKINNLNVSVVNVEKVQVPMADLGEGPGGQAPLILGKKRRHCRRKKSQQDKPNTTPSPPS